MYILKLLFISVLLFSLLSSNCKERHITVERQSTILQISKKVGGPCEGCEAIHEYGDKMLSDTDTLPGFEETDPKLKIYGTVYNIDGKTPASEVIIYIYHTNRKGVYQTIGDEVGWAKRHGQIRGWTKTDNNGEYTFYTFRPAAYPDGQEPEHIHVTIKEPGKNEYYLDDYLFDDDPLLTPSKRQNLKNRGGSGIISPVQRDKLYMVKRDIVLGLNIPDYF